MSKGCSPGCRYVKLYAASQQSLENLARSSAAAVARNTALREGVLAALRSHYPRAFAEAERKVPGGFANVPDAVVLAYVDGFLATPPEQLASRSGSTAAGLSALREALTARGVELPAVDDPAAWAIAVAGSSHFASEQPPAGGAAVSREVPVVLEEPSPEAVGDSGLNWLFDEDDAPPDFDPPSEVFDEVVVVEAPSFDGAVAQVGLSSLFDPPPVEVDEVAAVVVEAAEVGPAVEVREGGVDVVGPDEGGASVDGATVEPWGDEAPPPVPLVAKGTERGATEVGVKVQPTLLPQASPSQQRKRRRTAPSSMSSPVAVQPASDVTLSERQAEDMVAMVSRPSPVFVEQAAAVLGVPASAVSVWAATEATSSTPRIRIVGAKDAHAARGDLLVAHTPLFNTLGKAFTDSVWGRCVAGLRGGRLFDAGVCCQWLVSAKTFDFDRYTVTLVGENAGHAQACVLVTSADLAAGSAVRAAVADVVERLQTAGLHQIVVVTSSVAKRAPVDIAEALVVEADARKWQVTTPVVVSRASDLSSSSAVFVAAVG